MAKSKEKVAGTATIKGTAHPHKGPSIKASPPKSSNMGRKVKGENC